MQTVDAVYLALRAQGSESPSITTAGPIAGSAQPSPGAVNQLPSLLTPPHRIRNGLLNLFLLKDWNVGLRNKVNLSSTSHVAHTSVRRDSLLGLYDFPED